MFICILYQWSAIFLNFRTTFENLKSLAGRFGQKKLTVLFKNVLISMLKCYLKVWKLYLFGKIVLNDQCDSCW